VVLCGWEGNRWRKVMAAYRWVDESPAGWLPVHRDQLWAQRWAMSIRSLTFYAMIMLWTCIWSNVVLDFSQIHPDLLTITLRIITLPLVGVCSIAISVSVLCAFVCLSVRLHISKTMHPNFMKFSIHFACGYGSVLLWWQWFITYFQFCRWRHIFTHWMEAM